MNRLYIYLAVLSVFIMSCEDVIEIDSGFKEASLVVDAWIDDLERPQTVRLTKSQDYFDSQLATGVSGAQVTVKRSDGVDLTFEDNGNGNYVWTPTAGETLGEVGLSYTLEIEAEGVSFIAETVMDPVPVIDSIAQIYEEEQFGFPEGIYAELFATDLDGIGNAYWARTWKNDTLLNKPFEMAIIYDGTFSPGTGTDGIPFIFPIRRQVNPIADDLEEGEEAQAPYKVGDKIYVELSSISEEAFDFLTIAFEQMTNGDNGIFTLPLANSGTNVRSVGTEVPVLGFFNVASTSTKTKMIE